MIEWREDGFFSYRAFDKSVYGCTHDAATLTEILKRAGVLESPRTLFQVTTDIPDIGHDSSVNNEVGYGCESDFAAKLRPEALPPGMLDELMSIGSNIPATSHGVHEYLSQRADELNTEYPQVLPMGVFGGGTECYSSPGNLHVRGYGTWVDWIDPRLIVSTRDPVWNDIDRNPRRSSVQSITAGLRDAASTGDLTEWLRRMYSPPGHLFVNRTEGPAGPIYETSSGTHRTHAARLLRLPGVLARIVPVTLPTPAIPGGDSRQIPDDSERLWRGLRDRGLISAEVIDGHWHFGKITAEWMLASPALATTVNAAYERLYPGALQQATGMSLEQLTYPTSWRKALTGRTFVAKEPVHSRVGIRQFWRRGR